METKTTPAAYTVGPDTARLLDAVKFTNVDLFAVLKNAASPDDDDLTDNVLLDALQQINDRLGVLLLDSVRENLTFSPELKTI